MPTFTQAILLGSDRLSVPPTPPHPALADAWAQLDWSGSKETALLEASSLVGGARSAGAVTCGPLSAAEIAGHDPSPRASARATAVLRRLLAEEWHALLPEWFELCARHDQRVHPFFLPTLFALVANPAERLVFLRTIGERGRWLARQNPEWSWVVNAAPQADESLWETGTEDERLATLRDIRVSDPARANEILLKTWSDDPADFRLRALTLFHSSLSLADEPLLTRALSDRRKEIRSLAQSFLAALSGSGLSQRMQAAAEKFLVSQRGLLGRKLEVHLPAAFEAGWKADAIEEKPPAGVGEKAHWVQQILALVPITHWSKKFSLEIATLVELAAKSSDWGDLLLGAWIRAAVVHHDAEASSLLIGQILPRPKAVPPGMSPQPAAAALLAICHESQRWQIAAANADLAWMALPLLTGTPTAAQGRALFEQLSTGLRDGLNPGGSPSAVLAARRVPPELHAKAARRLERDHGLSKPAETFLQALEIRAEIHTAFSTSTTPPEPS